MTPILSIAVFGVLFFLTHAATAVAEGGAGAELSESSRALLSAVHLNDTDAVERMLSAGVDPNVSDRSSRDGDGHVLCSATAPGREKSLRLIIDYGADVNILYGDNHWYGSPLTCAITRGNVEAFELLLDAGAAPDLDVCTFCDYEINTGPTEVALDNNKYWAIWRLIELDAVNERALEDVVHALNRYLAFGEEVADPYRRKLVEWLEARGTALDLRTPLPD